MADAEMIDKEIIISWMFLSFIQKSIKGTTYDLIVSKFCSVFSTTYVACLVR
jgi:hypothetical protein